MPGEFEIIDRYFKPLNHGNASVSLGIGDDAALLLPSKMLAITMDTLVAGTHFLHEDPPDTLGHKALAVNLSDLAAMGAIPTMYLLSLTIPKADEHWLADFTQGMGRLADHYGISLVGGDTTSGPLSITITAIGEVDPQQCLRRDAAVAGDDIYVTGQLGAAALFIHARRAGMTANEASQRAYRCPEPRVELGRALASCAHACIDISDGLASDLGHILKASQVGARLDVEHIPLSAALSALTDDQAVELALNGGDDYELCFTASKAQQDKISVIAQRYGIAITRIGVITEDNGKLTLMRENKQLDWRQHGWDHFKDT